MSEMGFLIEANSFRRKSVLIMVRLGLDLRSDSGAKARRSIIVDGLLGASESILAALNLYRWGVHRSEFVWGRRQTKMPRPKPGHFRD